MHFVDTTPQNQLQDQITFDLIGKHVTRGQGCGGDAALGRKAAEESLNTLWDLIPEKGHVVFLASMAGGTGAGVLPAIYPLAGEKKSQAIAVVTMPLINEGVQRAQMAVQNLKRLDHLKSDLITIEQKHLDSFLPAKTFVDNQTIYDLLSRYVMWKTLAALSG